MRFSVIMPLYNKGPYVRKALESVCSQCFLDFELIVVDDGSTDDSYSIAKEVLEKAHIEYNLIHQDNSGVSTARNNGVAASHGDYLCFLDADDWWSPSFLERMNGMIDAYPDAGIYGTNYYYVKNGKERICVTTAQTGYINYCKVYTDTLSMPLTSISVAIPRSVFEQYEGFKPWLKLGEDFDLWIRIALRMKVAFLDEPLAYYNQDSNPKYRGIKQLVKPESHMLWNLGYLEEEEKHNPDYKCLVDALRANSLMPYLLSRAHRTAAREELCKVDWDHQPAKLRQLYHKPLLYLKCRWRFLKSGAAVKQWLIKHL